MTNASYDAIVGLLKHIYQKFHKRPIYKIQGGAAEEQPANIQFIVGNNLLVLPVDVDNEKFQYTVDRFMELAMSSIPSETTYTFYSEEENSVLRKTEDEIIRDEYEKQLHRAGQ